MQSGFSVTNTDTLASAPPKLTLNIFTEKAPNPELTKKFKLLVSSKKLEPKVTPLVLELVDNRIEPRGKMTADSVSIVTPLSTDSESFKVLAHELGHVADIHYLKSGIFAGDPSQEFYNISWIDMTTKKQSMSLSDFVSGYAMTNKYEDFAECFTYFLFHNSDFALRSKKSLVLKEKYNFFKKYVFPDGEFL